MIEAKTYAAWAMDCLSSGDTPPPSMLLMSAILALLGVDSHARSERYGHCLEFAPCSQIADAHAMLGFSKQRLQAHFTQRVCVCVCVKGCRVCEHPAYVPSWVCVCVPKYTHPLIRACMRNTHTQHTTHGMCAGRWRTTLPRMT